MPFWNLHSTSTLPSKSHNQQQTNDTYRTPSSSSPLFTLPPTNNNLPLSTQITNTVMHSNQQTTTTVTIPIAQQQTTPQNVANFAPLPFIPILTITANSNPYFNYNLKFYPGPKIAKFPNFSSKFYTFTSKFSLNHKNSPNFPFIKFQTPKIKSKFYYFSIILIHLML